MARKKKDNLQKHVEHMNKVIKPFVDKKLNDEIQNVQPVEKVEEKTEKTTEPEKISKVREGYAYKI